jgi:glutathione S-transferase
MLTLFDNSLSPFARKVRLALDLKEIEHTVIDGLALANREALAAVNGRVEVPVIDHDGLVVASSSDIIAYLERVWPARALYPSDHAAWMHARAWERCADTLIDPITVDISYWSFFERDDRMPEGMLDKARHDLEGVYAALERDLDGSDFVSGAAVSIADVALFPHLSATRLLGVGHDPERHPRLHAWLKRLRALAPFGRDLERARLFMSEFVKSAGHERRKIFWRGDRIEWVLARGFHRWFMGEIEADRVLWPGLGIPGKRARNA